MKHTEEQIRLLAQKVLNDINWGYDKEKGLLTASVTIEEQIISSSSMKDHPKYEAYIATFKNYWSVYADFPVEDSWGERNMMWVKIDDETGIPYEVGHRQFKSGLELIDGKYVKIRKG
jgi:hypothetical protein